MFLTYLLGARLYGRRQGLLAAALVSLAVIHIQLSHFLTFDIVLGFTTIAALYFMHRVAVGGRLRDSVIAGVIVGLGLATKVSMAAYVSGAGNGPLALCHACAGRSGGR